MWYKDGVALADGLQANGITDISGEISSKVASPTPKFVEKSLAKYNIFKVETDKKTTVETKNESTTDNPEE